MPNFKLNSKNNFIIIILFFCGKTFSQDTINFKNGLKQCVKVAEVRMLELKYRRCDNLTGPDYFLDKGEISFIKYSNGVVEKFNDTPQNTIAIIPPKNQDPKKLLELGLKNKFIINQQYYGNTELLTLFFKYPKHEIRSALKLEFDKLLTYQRARPLLLIGGLGIGFAVPVITSIVSMWSYPPNYNLIFGGIFLGGIIRTLGCAYATMNKNKAINQRKKILELYNNNLP